MTMTDEIRSLQVKLARLTRRTVVQDGLIGPQTIGAMHLVADELANLRPVQASSAAPAPQGPSGAGSSKLGHPAANTDSFSRALPVILRHEGGFVNDPDDPGGMTNLGVTKATWESWTGRPASEAEMRSLTIDQVAPLYHANYWYRLRCGELPPALALCVFDFGVNAGPERAARYLQRLAGAPEDGEVGPVTLAAVSRWIQGVGFAEAVWQYQEARRGYYRKLPTFPKFGRGWLRRVDETESEALRWL